MTVMNRQAIVLFTGDPERESVRKGLPSNLLRALHQELIATIRRTNDVALIVASDALDTFRLEDDRGGRSFAESSFGAKVASAFRFAFDRGFDSVVLLAGDIAGADRAVLVDAFALLEEDPRRSVVGPSGDGGFYLLGLHRRGGLDTATNWDAVRWFTPSAAASVTTELTMAGGSVSFLRNLDDIDCRADAVRIGHALPERFAALRARLRSLLSARQPRATSRIAFQPVVLEAATLLRAPPTF